MAIALAAALTGACATGAPSYRSFDELPYTHAEQGKVWSKRSRTLVHWAREGSGPRTPLILIHPWGTNLLVWQQIAPQLAEGRSVYMIDLPGHGKTSKPPGRYPPRRLVGAVLDVLDHVGAKRAILMGNSLGGATALATAIEAPDRIAGLVLLAAPGAEPVPAPVLDWLRGNATPNRVARISNESIAFGWHAIGGSHSPFVKHLLAQTVATRRSPEWKHFSLAASSALVEVAAWTPTLEAIVAPTLIVQGLDDPVVWPWTGRTMAERIARSELFEIDGCGHCPQIECPEVLMPRVTKFLEGID